MPLRLAPALIWGRSGSRLRGWVRRHAPLLAVARVHGGPFTRSNPFNRL
jgi:hypothetical protein